MAIVQSMYVGGRDHLKELANGGQCVTVCPLRIRVIYF